MTEQFGKMSEILLEMSQRLLCADDSVPSSEAAHVTLFFATAAWNESVGVAGARDGYRRVWETIEADNPTFWNELKSNDVEAMVDELVRYKKSRYPGDRRRILVCGILEGKIRVEWLPAVADGVDPQWETQLYGLVRTGDRKGAVRFLQTTRNMSHARARTRVAKVAAQLGMT
jgi:hypothetical protein